MSTEIREAGPGDLEQIKVLLQRREGPDAPWCGSWRASSSLDRNQLRAWVAVEGRAIVGLSCVELHALQVDDAIHDAGRWTVSHVREGLGPELRAALIEATLRCARSPIYALCRDPAEAAQRLRHGLVELQRHTLRVRPLRPLSLAAKGLGLPDRAARAAAPLDRVAALPVQLASRRSAGLPRGSSIVELTLPEDSEGIAELIAHARAGRISRRWDARSLEARFAPTPEGGAHTVLGLVRAGEIVAVAAYRVFASFWDGLSVAVIGELAARGDDRALLAALLRAIERRADAAGVEAVLVLDALGPEVSALLRGAGYLDDPLGWGPAVLIAGPPAALAATPRLGAVLDWRLSG